MQIKFLGAAGTVTGSSYILTSGSGRSILIDLGMFQGLSDIEKLNYDPYEYNCARLVGAVLTHAHLDHCGRLPILMSHGFKGDIWMTPPTADLAELALLDSANVARNSNHPILYDKKLATKTVKKFRTVPYHAPFHVGDFTITFYDAGHILGSTFLDVVDTQPDSSIRRIIFSGDLGNSPEDLLRETEHRETADAVVLESTYGDRLHPKEDATDTIASEIHAVEANDGTLLIPAFSLQRTQELLHMIMHLKKNGKIQMQTPVYMDSPMGREATIIYERYPEYFNTHIQEERKVMQPFEFPGLVEVGKRYESQALDNEGGAKVIIAGSGMMTGGRIVGHAARFLSVSTTRLLIVGYQGEGTLGRLLMEGNRQVVIDGVTVHVKATVNNTQAMSSHADQGQLMDWMRPIKNIKKIFLVHGDDEPRKILAQKITEELGILDVALPYMQQEVKL